MKAIFKIMFLIVFTSLGYSEEKASKTLPSINQICEANIKNVKGTWNSVHFSATCAQFKSDGTLLPDHYLSESTDKAFFAIFIEAFYKQNMASVDLTMWNNNTNYSDHRKFIFDGVKCYDFHYKDRNLYIQKSTHLNYTLLTARNLLIHPYLYLVPEIHSSLAFSDDYAMYHDSVRWNRAFSGSAVKMTDLQILGRSVYQLDTILTPRQDGATMSYSVYFDAKTLLALGWDLYKDADKKNIEARYRIYKLERLDKGSTSHIPVTGLLELYNKDVLASVVVCQAHKFGMINKDSYDELFSFDPAQAVQIYDRDLNVGITIPK